MSDAEEESVDEFQDYLLIRWKVNILYPKFREFSFRKSKLDLSFDPRLCDSSLLVFLHQKEKKIPRYQYTQGGATYTVESNILDKNGEEVFTKYCKVYSLSERPVIFKIKREKLKYKRYLFSSPQILVLCFKIGTLATQWHPSFMTPRISEEDSPESEDEPDKEPSSSLEKLSDDISQQYNSLEHSDVIIKSGDRKISAHKNILSARSEVFAAMFRDELLEIKNGILEITDVKPEVLNQFLRYLYSGKIELCMESAYMLYEAADKYAVDDLKKYCGSYLFKNLEDGNAFKIVVLADDHGDEDLRESVMVFMVRKRSFLLSDQWDVFSDEYPALAVKVYRMFIGQ